ncbi:hypothetical protein ES703_18266 [subsurface metagenome]
MLKIMFDFLLRRDYVISSEVIMDKQIRLLKETMAIKNLSPEQAAIYLGCTGRQIRRWIEGKAKTTPVYLKAIEAGIRKIGRELPGDKDGVVNWRGVEIPEEEKAVNDKVTGFLVELVKAARARGRSFTSQEDENFLGFEETCLLAKRLKVELPKI